jgi:hypothetical protein
MKTELKHKENDMDVYLELQCANCYETMYKLVRTYDIKNDKPVISATMAEQSTWSCDECDKDTVVGELDVVSEDDL